MSSRRGKVQCPRCKRQFSNIALHLPWCNLPDTSAFEHRRDEESLKSDLDKVVKLVCVLVLIRTSKEKTICSHFVKFFCLEAV